MSDKPRYGILVVAISLGVLAVSLVIGWNLGDGMGSNSRPEQLPTKESAKQQPLAPSRNQTIESEASTTFTLTGVVMTDRQERCPGVSFSLLASDLSPTAQLANAVSVKTAEDGRFQTLPLMRGTWVLRVMSAGWNFADGEAPIVCPRPEERHVQLNVVLTKDLGLFRGVIKTADGLPVRGQQVVATGTGLLMTATTDAVGAFRMEPLATSQGRVVEKVDVVIGDSDGYQFQGWWPCQDKDYEFVLPRPCDLVVRFQDQWKAQIASFAVRLTSLTQHGIPQSIITSSTVHSQMASAPVSSTVTGSVEFGALRPGRYLVSCSRPEGAREEVSVLELRAGDQRTVVLQESAKFRLVVHDAQDGMPLRDATVIVGSLLGSNARTAHWMRPSDINAQTGNMPGGVIVIRAEARTGKDGTAEFPSGGGGGAWKEIVLVKASGYVSALEPLVEIKDAAVRLKRAQTVRGIVTGWEPCRVALDLEEANAYARLVGDRSVVMPVREESFLPMAHPISAEGRFQIGGLHSGTWELLVAARNNRIVLGTFDVPCASDVVVDATRLAWRSVRFVVESERPLTSVSLGVCSDSTVTYPSRWLQVRLGKTQPIGMLHGRTKVVLASPDCPFRDVLTTDVWIDATTDATCLLRVPYREAVIEVNAAETNCLFAVTQERDRVPGVADYKLKVRSGKLRVRWAPPGPFWVRARSLEVDQPDTVFGPYELGAARDATFQAGR